MRSVREVRTKEWLAGLLAGAGATINAGAFMMLTGSELLNVMGWPAFVGYTMGGALLFPVVMAKGGNPAAYGVIFLTSISRLFHSLISDLVKIFGLVSLTTYISFVYTFVIWIAVVVVVVPLALGSGDPNVVFPNTGASALFPHVIYALFLGSFYGFILQDYL